jgi:hypothetical protein
MKKMKLFFLDITYWEGGLQHKYGRISDGDPNSSRDDIELDHLIDPNKEYYYPHTTRAERAEGHRIRSIVFETNEEVFEAAKRWYRREAPKRSVLIYGKTYVIGPQNVLAAPRGLKKKLNAIYEEFQKGDRRGNPDKKWVADMEKKWETLLR